jgi:sugar lactone lactonase YvrE
MPSKPLPSRKTQILMTGIAMGESPRWHENRLWFSDWGAQEIVAVDLNGKSEITVRVQFGLPFCIDWLRDGRLLVVSGEGLLLRREADGSLVTHADLHGPAGMGWNGRRRRSRKYIYHRWLGNRSADARWLHSTGSRQHRLPEWHGNHGNLDSLKFIFDTGAT